MFHSSDRILFTYKDTSIADMDRKVQLMLSQDNFVIASDDRLRELPFPPPILLSLFQLLGGRGKMGGKREEGALFLSLCSSVID